MLADHFAVQLITDISTLALYLKKSNFALDQRCTVTHSPLPRASDYRKNDFYYSVFGDLIDRYRNDFVISDNYLEPFEFTKKGILIANFLWQEQFDSDPPFDYSSLTEMVLVHNGFANDRLIHSCKSINVGLFGPRLRAEKSDLSIIVTSGYGDWCEGTQDHILSQLSKYKFFGSTKIKFGHEFVSHEKKMECLFHDVDCSIMPRITIDDIAKAVIICGRPSIGIVSDSWLRGVPFVPFFKENDREAAFNAWVIDNTQPELDLETADLIDLENMRLQFSSLPLKVSGELLIKQLVMESILQ